METAITGRFPFSGFQQYDNDRIYLFWGSKRWKSDDYPDSIFDDIPEDGLPIRKIYVDETTGKLVIQYEDEEEE